MAIRVVALASPDSYDAYNPVFTAKYLLEHSNWHYINTFAQTLREYGFELVVYAFSESGEPGLYRSRDGSYSVRLIRPSPLTLKLLHMGGPWRYLATLVNTMKLVKPILEDHPNVVINTHFPHFPRGEALSLLSKLVGTKFGYLQSISLPGRSPYDYVARLFQHITDFYIFTEADGVEESRRRYIIPQGKTHLVGLLPHVHPHKDGVRRRAQTHERNILYVGRLEDKQKAVSNLIEAFARLAPLAPEATLTIVGDGTDRERLKSIAKRTGYPQRIHFTGWLTKDELAQQYHTAYLFCLPSRRESYSLVLTEAMLAGLPVVCSDLPQLGDRAINGVTALTAKVDDMEELSNKLLLLLRDEEYASTLGRNARKRIEQIIQESREQLPQTLRLILTQH